MKNFLRKFLRDERGLTAVEYAIAGALGVRREGVTEALGQLQHSGAIEVARCCVRIHDRAHLERLACECYPIIRDLRRLQTLAA